MLQKTILLERPDIICTGSYEHIKSIQSFDTPVTLWVVSVSVGVGASQRIPFSVLAQNPHKGLAREISPETGRRRGKGGSRDSRYDRTSRHERAVKRSRTQLAEGSRRDQSTEQVSQEMRVGQRGDQSTEVRKSAARTCSLTDAGLTNARR